jgi:hypothetical protein
VFNVRLLPISSSFVRPHDVAAFDATKKRTSSSGSVGFIPQPQRFDNGNAMLAKDTTCRFRHGLDPHR